MFVRLTSLGCEESLSETKTIRLGRAAAAAAASIATPSRKTKRSLGPERGQSRKALEKQTRGDSLLVRSLTKEATRESPRQRRLWWYYCLARPRRPTTPRQHVTVALRRLRQCPILRCVSRLCCPMRCLCDRPRSHLDYLVQLNMKTVFPIARSHYSLTHITDRA